MGLGFDAWEIAFLLLLVAAILTVGRLAQARRKPEPVYEPPAPPPVPTIACSNCGAINVAPNKFCSACGTSLAEPEAALEPTSTRTCPSCATVNPGTQAFCGQCGTRLTEAAA